MQQIRIYLTITLCTLLIGQFSAYAQKNRQVQHTSVSTAPHTIVTPVSPEDMLLAMDIEPADIIQGSATFNGSDEQGIGLSDSPLSYDFPLRGSTFGVLSTGYAHSVTLPDDPGNPMYTVLDGLNNSDGHDMVQFRFQLRVPSQQQCAYIGFKFLTEEYPDFVNLYHDTFTIEVGESTQYITNNTVIAPNNIAFDTDGNPITVDSSFQAYPNTQTMFNASTPTLFAQTPVTPGTVETFIITIQDIADSWYDSAVFLDAFRWAPYPCPAGTNVDTDGDALPDVWEINGVPGVDLPAMGANPLRKDIFVEVDYMQTTDHHHRLDETALQWVIDAFRDAPVANPDGSTGISLHIDGGSLATIKENAIVPAYLSKSNAVPETLYIGQNGSWDTFDQLKAQHFDVRRIPIFHYAIAGHYADTSLPHTVKGRSRGIPGKDFYLALAPDVPIGDINGTLEDQAGFFMHELGHNLGIRHGGHDDITYKPNHFSVMNYSYTPGIPLSIGFANPYRLFDYSRFSETDVASLDENALNELHGVSTTSNLFPHFPNSTVDIFYYCNGLYYPSSNTNLPVDWNCDGSINTSISSDINNDQTLNVVSTINEWNLIVFEGDGTIGASGILPPPVTDTEPEPPFIDPPYAYGVSVVGPSILPIEPEPSSFSYPVTINNTGTEVATYTLSFESQTAWSSMQNMPSQVVLEPGSTYTMTVNVVVPLGVVTGDGDTVTVKAQIGDHPQAVQDIATTSIRTRGYMFVPMMVR